ncbi:MAG: glutamate synthase-related protein [Candidatus Methanarcanum hacksteinii]|nr:glutamate synthase-related protein [Candidatus Methanarcanum hacksteinii]
MAKYRCSVCGEIYDEEKEGVRFEDLPDDWVCPICHRSKDKYHLMEDSSSASTSQKDIDSKNIDIDPDLIRYDGGIMDEIREMSLTGKNASEPMDTLRPIPAFSDILFLGAQLARKPLEGSDDVSLRTVIGKGAAKPMELDIPVYISHMSFGALSANAKIALAKGSAMARTAMCSGEGGVLDEEMHLSHRYIFEYVPNRYSVNDDVFSGCDAVEIKIGQGTKPGMGGHLPGNKVTAAIAWMRGKKAGEDILSPASFPEIRSPEDLKDMVDMLRARTQGKPIGVKIAAGHIEEDLEFISHSGCDFITIDGRGGATGSSPKFLKDVSSVPTVYALARARRYMDDHGMEQELVMTGGFRTGGDIMKAIAMGADAVAIASSALMALGCQRYRICDSGKCPMGIATQDPELVSRLDTEAGAKRVANYLEALSEQLRTFARTSGHSDIHDLSIDDLCTTDSEISDATGIRHA